MATSFLRSIVAILFVVTIARADTFEFLTYTPPASGWTSQVSANGASYRRTSGFGLILFYPSTPATGAAADEFAKAWSAKIEHPLALKAPLPKIETSGEYKIAVGGLNVDSPEGATSVSLVTIVGRGRAISISAVATGSDVLREVLTFLDSIAIAKAPSNSASNPAGTVEVDFDVPEGYTSVREGNTVVLKPANTNRTTPCFYGLSPSRPSIGNLEADARAALLEPLPGWQIKSDHYNAMRGIGGGGWPYYWLRTDMQRLNGASYEYFTAMAMAFSSGPGRVSIFWGFGVTGPCTVDDATFLRLFFSLKPRGWTSDGGKALGRELQGLWRDTQNAGMAQYQFASNGRYEYGLGTSTTFGNLETRTGSVHDGRWEVRGSDLTLTGGGRAGKYRVRVYDEFLGGVWRRAMSLLNESGLDVNYMRIGK